MLILNAEDVRRALPMRDAIEAMKQAFAALSAGRATVPPRAHLQMDRNAGISLFMPAYVDSDDPAQQALTIKAVSLFDHNQARGLARIQAAVLVLDPATGCPIALLEGATLTGIRTAAASGAATDLLAREDSRKLAVFGAGVQARTHIEAVCAVRDIEEIAIYGPTAAKVDRLIEEMSDRVTVKLYSAASPQEATRGADIICATTTSSTPIFSDADVQSGTHINAVGSYKPVNREVPAETVVRSLVVVDSRAAAWEEAGDLIQPLEAGLITRDHIHAELGEIVVGEKSGRTSNDQITFFRSVGIAVQDAFAAKIALANAKAAGIGQAVSW
ncbi:MAG: ornithine cyclodeaminase [Planctomycetota bacterium]|nr:ornithine cyclodeaminase [Planctomycetota bacterium]